MIFIDSELFGSIIKHLWIFVIRFLFSVNFLLFYVCEFGSKNCVTIYFLLENYLRRLCHRKHWTFSGKFFYFDFGFDPKLCESDRIFWFFVCVSPWRVLFPKTLAKKERVQSIGRLMCYGCNVGRTGAVTGPDISVASKSNGFPNRCFNDTERTIFSGIGIQMADLADIWQRFCVKLRCGWFRGAQHDPGMYTVHSLKSGVTVLGRGGRTEFLPRCHYSIFTKLINWLYTIRDRTQLGVKINGYRIDMLRFENDIAIIA